MEKKLTVKEAQNLMQIKVTGEDIKKYFCPLATEKEVFMALGIIRSLNLNPFKKEVHLIKYSSQNPISIVVGYEVYLKRAERTGKLDGWEQGMSEDGAKAWIKIYRKDWKIPFYWEVTLSEFSKNQATWKQIPDFMGRKVAIAQGFRLAFPDELGGMPYTQEEHMVFDINAKLAGKPSVTQPEALSAPKEEKSKEEQPTSETPYKLMLEKFAKAKVVLGEEKYYEILRAEGYNKPNEIKHLDEGEIILAQMRAETAKGDRDPDGRKKISSCN